jgi:hypothetical protein
MVMFQKDGFESFARSRIECSEHWMKHPLQRGLGLKAIKITVDWDQQFLCSHRERAESAKAPKVEVAGERTGECYQGKNPENGDSQKECSH